MKLISDNQKLDCIHEMFFGKEHSRTDLMTLDRSIRALPGSFDKCPYPLFHSFVNGMYIREIHFNAGHLIVGAIHKNEYFVNVLKGRIWIISEFYAKDIIAPYSFSPQAGVKHICFTLEETIWVDANRANSTDVEKAKKEIFADSYEELDAYHRITNGDKLCLDG